MRAKRRWAAFAVVVGLLAGSLGGGIALGESGDAMKDTSSGSGDAMQQQAPASGDAMTSAASMTG